VLQVNRYGLAVPISAKMPATWGECIFGWGKQRGTMRKVKYRDDDPERRY
jgi:hypothetical protein